MSLHCCRGGVLTFCLSLAVPTRRAVSSASVIVMGVVFVFVGVVLGAVAVLLAFLVVAVLVPAVAGVTSISVAAVNIAPWFCS